MDICTPEDCKGCRISQGKEIDSDGEPIQVVRLLGGWCINHYGGAEGYLGWLALQPARHLSDITELNDDETCSLGPSIKAATNALRQYRNERFKEKVERVYVVYFFESAESHPFHLHIHLIPRFAGMEGRLRAWDVPRATLSATFPKEYRRTHKDFKVEVRSLMKHLKDSLGSAVEDAAVQ